MAIKPTDNETFYREVDEELRREQLTGYWKRYGRWLVAAAILLILAFGAYLYWQHRQEMERGRQGALLASAFEDVQATKTAEATRKLDELTRDGSPGYRAIALLTKADILLDAGKNAEALTALRTVADDKAAAQPFRDHALIRMTHVEFDTLKPEAVIQRLQPLAKPGNPWFGSAGEMVAISYLKLNKPQQAGPLFAAIAKDPGVPESIATRSRQMASSLGLDAVPDTAGATKE
ncbi:MAG: tetratricopeptide repeat protein [Alphaproteobacteria bacterium]|nr:MAG: tetratricopeptide repeat protein [Alphaproteobacteria bacterium]